MNKKKPSGRHFPPEQEVKTCWLLAAVIAEHLWNSESNGGHFTSLPVCFQPLSWISPWSLSHVNFCFAGLEVLPRGASKVWCGGCSPDARRTLHGKSQLRPFLSCWEATKRDPSKPAQGRPMSPGKIQRNLDRKQEIREGKWSKADRA